LTRFWRNGEKGVFLRDELKLLTACHLVSEKKGLWIPPLAAQFERAKILAPWSFGNFWLRFHPKAQLIEVGESDMAVVHALDQMVSNRDGQREPSLDLRHQSPACPPGLTRLVLLTKDETA
jgi:hypothetical protein